MTEIPLPVRLETPRLVLRRWRPDDAGSLQEALVESAAELLPWIPWATTLEPPPDQASALLEGWARQGTAGDNVICAMVERTTGRVLGGIGLYRRVGPDALEIGYWVRTSAAGMGYATEATRALTRAGLDLPGVTSIEIHVDPRNAGSRRIPERLGFTLRDVRPREAAPGREGGETAVYVFSPRSRSPDPPGASSSGS